MADRRHEAGGAPRSYRNRTVDLWLALAVALGACAAATLSAPARAAGPAPGFTLVSTGYEDGADGPPQEFSLADYRGRTVVLDLMAVACTTCRTVTQEVLKPLHERHPDVAILSIDTWADPGAGGGVDFGGETAASLVALQRSEGVPWRHALDTDQVWRKYAAVGLPKLVVVDPDGDIVYAKAGAQSLGRVEAAVQAAAVGDAVPLPQLQLGLVAFAAVAGLAVAVAPCGVGLLPAYLGLLLEDGARAPPAARAARAAAGSLRAAAAVAALYALLAAAAWGASGLLRAALPWLGPLLGLALFALGAAALAGADWSALARRLGLRPAGAPRGFAAFGAAYGLAGLACTGPVFLPLLLEGFASSPATGLAVFAAYAAAVAGTLAAAALLVAAGEASLLRRLLAHARWLHKASAAVLALGGLYVAWYSARAYGLL